MNLQDAAGMAVAFVVFVITVGIGASVLGALQISQAKQTTAECLSNPLWANCSTFASNVSGAGLTGSYNLGSQSGTIGTVIGAAIIISIVVGAFYFANRQ